MNVNRTATCSCGQLKATVSGEPIRIAICHCLACQRRTGSVFSAQARFLAKNVTISGQAHLYSRGSESGNQLTFHFCPSCAATVHYSNTGWPGTIGIPVGAFADPDFPGPTFSVYEMSKHGWVPLPGPEIVHEHD
jgi:hypothetical protein